MPSLVADSLRTTAVDLRRGGDGLQGIEYRLNAEANAHRCLHPPRAAALAWGCDDAALFEALTALGQQPIGEAIVLCSDVVYEPTAYAPLLATLRQLARHGIATRTIMAHRSRHPDENLFFAAATEHFTMRQLHGPPFVPLGAPGSEGSGGGTGSTVRILEFTALAAAVSLE